jgi:hypothetical protein
MWLRSPAAFIEKMLTLDTAGKYFIRTCGEEPMVAYNRVGLTGMSSIVCPGIERRLTGQSTFSIGILKTCT